MAAWSNRGVSPALAFLALFGGLILSPQLRHMRGVPDYGDPLFSVWRLGWIYQQVRGDPRSLFDANIFHPEPSAFAFSDSILLPGLIAAPLHAVGIHPVAAYNALLCATFVGSAWAAFLLARRLTGSTSGAVVAGLIFGFYPYRFEHYSHLELQMTVLMPVTLHALFLMLDSGKVRWAVVAALGLAGQLYCSMYYGAVFPLYAAIVFAGWWVVGRARVPVRRTALAGLTAAVLSAILAAPLAVAYLGVPQVRGGRSVEEVRHFSATLMDYTRAHRRSAFWANLTPAGRAEERQLFPGLTVALLAAAGLVFGQDRRRWAIVAAGILAFDLSLGANGLSFPLLYEGLTPFRSIRVPARFSIMVGLSLAVLAAYGIARASALPPSRRRAILAGAVLGVTIDVWPTLHLKAAWNSPPAYYAALTDPGVVLAEFPAGPPERFSAIPYLYFSVWHWRPLVNGYSGFHPPSYTGILDMLERFPEPETIDLLQSRGVTHVTVNCALFDLAGFSGRCARTLAAAAGVPTLREVARTEWQGADAVLFRLDASNSRPPTTH